VGVGVGAGVGVGTGTGVGGSSAATDGMARSHTAATAIEHAAMWCTSRTDQWLSLLPSAPATAAPEGRDTVTFAMRPLKALSRSL